LTIGWRLPKGRPVVQGNPLGRLHGDRRIAFLFDLMTIFLDIAIPCSGDIEEVWCGEMTKHRGSTSWRLFGGRGFDSGKLSGEVSWLVHGICK
jgi:hypothetical protein